jgi:hypothetical protein
MFIVTDQFIAGMLVAGAIFFAGIAIAFLGPR